MRAALLLTSLSLTVSLAVSAPTPPGPRVKDRAKLRESARLFAQRADHFADQIARRHVREVPREALLTAMITALYQEARRPLPPGLARQIEEACADAAPEPGMPPPVTPAREELLARLRLRLGDVDGLSDHRAMEVCCAAVIRLLDPHSGLLTDADRRRSSSLEQESVGVGMVLSDHTGLGPMVVQSVLLGSPAARAGLRPGDRITHIEGAPVAKAAPAALAGLKTSSASHDDLPLVPGSAPNAPKARKAPGVLRVEYVRPGQTRPLAADLLPGRFRAESVLGTRRRGAGWDFFAEEKTGLAHVRIGALGKGTADELRLALLDLRRRKMRGLVLDLRWCPGGFLNEAVQAAELFLGEGTIATVKMRDRPDDVYRSTDGGKFREFPIVVLVNGETVGGAELIAAALQDHRRAAVIGQQTKGKASVQTPIVVAPGIDFKVTSGTFVRPSGKPLHRSAGAEPGAEWGVVPDEDFRTSPELSRRLRGWWRDFSLRPAGSRDRHPLDLPGADPQQVYALKVLQRLVEQDTRMHARAK